MVESLDLGAYLARIGHPEPRRADLATLSSLHRAHALAIPFENLDIQMGRPIRLDLESLQRKLVAGARGGYCFEQNTLFLAVLRAAGFETIACEARVRPPGARAHVLPRTHMVLVVSLGERRWLCDVGFGGDGPVEPVPLDGEEVEQLGDLVRVCDEGSLKVLQFRGGAGHTDQYAFLPDERYPVDFEVASWYTSTHPESRFVVSLTAQRVRADGRHVLRGLTYTTRLGEAAATREVPRAELDPLLRDTFGIAVPPGARFRALDGS